VYAATESAESFAEGFGAFCFLRTEVDMTGVIVAVLLGILARTLLPFLQTLKANPETKFDRKFLLPAGIALLISIITAPFVFLAIPPDQIGNLTPNFQSLLILFAAAWGVTDGAREGQKFFSATS
jgi:Flp pilus assembly pilin Flp